MSSNTRKKLAELLKDDPSLVEDLRSMLAEGAEDASPPEEVSHVFEGTLSDATFTQTRKSLKYDGKIAVIDGENSEAEAIVVVYLPPEVATSDIIVSVVADGATTSGRETSSHRRKKAS